MGKYIVTINEDYDDWKIKGLLAEVIAWDRDKRFLVKLLENSKTQYLNIGDTIWLKPHWLDGIYDNLNRFTAIYKLPYGKIELDIEQGGWCSNYRVDVTWTVDYHRPDLELYRYDTCSSLVEALDWYKKQDLEVSN